METHATVSEREWADGVLDDAKLAELIRTFRECGFATIGNVVPAHALDALQRRMDYDAAHQAAALKWQERGPSSGAGGHLQMGVPRMAPFVAKEIVASCHAVPWSPLKLHCTTPDASFRFSVPISEYP